MAVKKKTAKAKAEPRKKAAKKKPSKKKTNVEILAEYGLADPKLLKKRQAAVLNRLSRAEVRAVISVARKVAGRKKTKAAQAKAHAALMSGRAIM